MNSIQSVGSNYLINGRYTNSVFYVSGEDGSIIWQLDGQSEGGNFTLSPNEKVFQFQHDARATNIVGDNFDLSVFNNNEGDDPTGAPPSELILLSISSNSLRNTTSMHPGNWTAVLQRKIGNEEPIYTGSMGSYQPIIPNSNGHQLGTYGTVSMIKVWSCVFA